MDSQVTHPPSFDLANLARLLRLRAELSIVHQVPGRVRLRLGPGVLTLAHDEGSSPEQAIEWLVALPGVRGVRINAAAASLIIEYDPRRLEPSDWETLVLGDDDAALNLVLGLLGEG
jgi:hypothetical protein